MSKLTLSETQPAKAKCKITNWPEYDRALVQRGDITLWFEEEFLRENWSGVATGKRGKPFKYSDAAIQTLLVLKAVFGVPYRAIEGFSRSLMKLIDSVPGNPDGYFKNTA